MIEFLPTANDILAIRVRKGLRREDLDELIGRMQTMIDRNPVTHVYADIDRLGSVDWRAAFDALPHSLGLFRLSRYGRVAIVSDDRLVRGWSRIESALLPGLRYEIFHSKEADRALNWVEGKIARPHEGALKILETDNPLVLAYEIDGTMTADDMDAAIEYLRPRLASELGPISVLGRVGEMIISEPTRLLHERYFQFKKETLARVARYAVVGGPIWLQLAVEAAEPLLPFEIKWFERSDEAAAWGWIGAHERGGRRTTGPKAAAMAEP